MTGDPYEAGKLSNILITAFYGEHEAWHGPIAWAQRRVIEADIYTDLSSRVSYYEKARELGLQHRGAVLIADSSEGQVSGFVDVGLPLFDMATRAFTLPARPEGLGAAAAPPPSCELRPYVSNLAVCESVRRQGVGRRLMAECEDEVRGWGAEHEFIWLEVSVDNEPAISFYRSLGYEEVRASPQRKFSKRTLFGRFWTPFGRFGPALSVCVWRLCRSVGARLPASRGAPQPPAPSVRQVEENVGREIKKKAFSYELTNVKRSLMRKALC